MGRSRLLLVSLVLLGLVGCGRERYQERMNNYVKHLEYDRRVKNNLNSAPDDKKFKDLKIYVQPPKDETLTQTSLLPPSEGRFELESSFKDAKDDAVLHVLARVKLPKKAPAKGAPPPPPPAPRGDFVRDVLGLVASVTPGGEALENPKFAEEVKLRNRFKRAIVPADGKEIKIYTYKQDNYDVALVFVYKADLKNQLSTKIDLCLETFAVGQRADQKYNNGGKAEEDVAPPVQL